MVRDDIKRLIEQALHGAQAAGALPEFDIPAFEVLHPKQPEHGDYTANAALVIGAALRKQEKQNSNPRTIAQALVDHLPQNPLLASAELAGPGFINVRLSDGWLQQQVAAVVHAGDRYAHNNRGAGKRCQVEFVSANPTGPIHYGGARNAVLGDAVANILAACGYDVQREYYVNDAGAQFALFGETLYARYMQALGHDIPLPEEGYQGEYMRDYAQTLCAQHGDRFATLPRAEAVPQIQAIGRTLVLRSLEEELARIGVRFDNWFSEKSLYDEGRVQEAIDFLEARGELYRREGALWFKASEYPGNEKDEVVVRSSGVPTYLAGDIAYHYDKLVRRGFDKVVNVWAVDHQGHVPRMKAVVAAFGLDPGRLVILLYDLVKLMREGQEVKLSKRKGTLIAIGDVVDEVGSDPIHFHLLLRSPESVIEFDLDLAVAQNNENPVFYVQYGHARICSILEKARAEGFAVDADPEAANLALLAHPSELALIRKILELEEQVELAAERLAPHLLTHYSIDLAKSFSAFYRDCRVVDAENRPLSEARLALCRAARTALVQTLTLLGVSAPESM